MKRGKSKKLGISKISDRRKNHFDGNVSSPELRQADFGEHRQTLLLRPHSGRQVRDKLVDPSLKAGYETSSRLNLIIVWVFLLGLFCSNSLPLTSASRLDQRIQAFSHSKKCCRSISATSRIIWKNSWELRELNSGLLGEKCKCYLCAIPPSRFC